MDVVAFEVLKHGWSSLCWLNKVSEIKTLILKFKTQLPSFSCRSYILSLVHDLQLSVNSRAATDKFLQRSEEVSIRNVSKEVMKHENQVCSIRCESWSS